MIYLSDQLQVQLPEISDELTAIFHKHDLQFQYVRNCKDIWIRDFFPIKSNNGMISYKYAPSYLDDDPNYITTLNDLDLPFQTNDIDIKLDGGNVIISPDGNTVILCDRVFDENPEKIPGQLIEILKSALNAKIIVIPSDPQDTLGHADGYVRWVDNDTVLIAQDAYSDPNLESKMKYQLKVYRQHLLVNPIHNEVRAGIPSAVGCYINFFHHEPLIILPQFGLPEDEKGVETIKRIYADHIIETLQCRELAQRGGVLNCVTAVA